MLKMGKHFHIWLRSGPMELIPTPHPSSQPDREKTFFFTTSLSEPLNIGAWSLSYLVCCNLAKNCRKALSVKMEKGKKRKREGQAFPPKMKKGNNDKNCKQIKRSCFQNIVTLRYHCKRKCKAQLKVRRKPHCT